MFDHRHSRGLPVDATGHSLEKPSGGVIGVSVGSLSIGGFQLIVAPFSVVLAFAVSAAIGLFFGFYPANKAAAMSPITALRYE